MIFSKTRNKKLEILQYPNSDMYQNSLFLPHENATLRSGDSI